ncbi:MAG: tetratricopeptide repeat protein [Bryobacteraceae bacterium]
MNRIFSKRLSLFALLVFVFFAFAALAQTTYMITGKVIGEDGKPIQNAIIKIERKDIRWNANVKTNRRGEYTHAGVPVGGTYRVALEIDGKEVDFRDNVRPRLGEPAEINFDLLELKKTREAQRLAAETGTLTAEQARMLTPEQREEIERTLKARAAEIAKNKALNDAFNAGVEAATAGRFQEAVDAFTKAAEIDPKQDAVWARLADAAEKLGVQKTGAEQEAAFAKCVEAYQKALELKPSEAAYYNNYGLALVRMRKIPEAVSMLEKATQLDPANAAKYYYNMGAVMMNTGQNEAAGEAFKKAIEANPKYAPAQYQYGIYLVGKAQIGADGRIQPPPGTREAFQAYLELEPNGQFAQSAKEMLASFDQAIQTEYMSPEAKKKAEEAERKKQQKKR